MTLTQKLNQAKEAYNTQRLNNTRALINAIFAADNWTYRYGKYGAQVDFPMLENIDPRALENAFAPYNLRVTQYPVTSQNEKSYICLRPLTTKEKLKHFLMSWKK